MVMNKSYFFVQSQEAEENRKHASTEAWKSMGGWEVRVCYLHSQRSVNKVSVYLPLGSFMASEMPVSTYFYMLSGNLFPSQNISTSKL